MVSDRIRRDLVSERGFGSRNLLLRIYGSATEIWSEEMAYVSYDDVSRCCDASHTIISITPIHTIHKDTTHISDHLLSPHLYL